MNKVFPELFWLMFLVYQIDVIDQKVLKRVANNSDSYTV